MVAFKPSNVANQKTLILIDAHVHLHQCFQVGQVFSAAAKNFSTYASQLGGRDYVGCLLLTEMAGEEWFLTQKNLSHSHTALTIEDDWTLKPTAEEVSLLAVHASGKQLVIVAGRQIITKEKLEVLALVTPQLFPDGLSLKETFEAITAARGIPVLPWGVGKWIGQRGRIVTEFLQENKVFLGDNSGRPLGWRHPYNFEVAESLKVPILPGTDPLPLTSEASRVGRFGLQLCGDFNLNCPGGTLYEMLHTLSPPLKTYGKLETPWKFLKNQLALRI